MNFLNENDFNFNVNSSISILRNLKSVYYQEEEGKQTLIIIIISMISFCFIANAIITVVLIITNYIEKRKRVLAIILIFLIPIFSTLIMLIFKARKDNLTLEKKEPSNKFDAMNSPIGGGKLKLKFDESDEKNQNFFPKLTFSNKTKNTQVNKENVNANINIGKQNSNFGTLDILKNNYNSSSKLNQVYRIYSKEEIEIKKFDEKNDIENVEENENEIDDSKKKIEVNRNSMMNNYIESKEISDIIDDEVIRETNNEDIINQIRIQNEYIVQTENGVEVENTNKELNNNEKEINQVKDKLEIEENEEIQSIKNPATIEQKSPISQKEVFSNFQSITLNQSHLEKNDNLNQIPKKLKIPESKSNENSNFEFNHQQKPSELENFNNKIEENKRLKRYLVDEKPLSKKTSLKPVKGKNESSKKIKAEKEYGKEIDLY